MMITVSGSRPSHGTASSSSSLGRPPWFAETASRSMASPSPLHQDSILHYAISYGPSSARPGQPSSSDLGACCAPVVVITRRRAPRPSKIQATSTWSHTRDDPPPSKTPSHLPRPVQHLGRFSSQVGDSTRTELVGSKHHRIVPSISLQLVCEASRHKLHSTHCYTAPLHTIKLRLRTLVCARL